MKKTIKAILSIIIFFAILISTIPAVVLADTIIAYGDCGDNAKWELDSDNKLTIKGTGSVSNSPWKDWDVLSIVVENGIEEISCDLRASLAKDISIPSTLKDIKAGAFSFCNSLQNIDVDRENNSYMDVEGVLFSKDGHILEAYPGGRQDEDYHIPTGVTSVRVYAFFDNDNLVNLYFPSSFSWFQAPLTSWCDNLLNYYVDGNNEKYCDLNGVLCRKDKARLFAFPSGRKGEYIVPSFMPIIEDYAFYSCTQIESITFPQGVSGFGEGTFGNCSSLRDLKLPESIYFISSQASYGCPLLKDIYVAHTEAQWKERFSDDLFDAIIHYNSFADTKFNIIFDSTGGTVEESKREVKNGERYGNLPRPHREGFVFDGWTRIPESSTYQVYSTSLIALTTDQYLYAKWIPKEELQRIDKYSYSFSNSRNDFGYSTDYTIPLSSYKIIYGDNARAEFVYADKTYTDLPNRIKRYWDGSCAGMSATSAILVDHTNRLNPMRFTNNSRDYVVWDPKGLDVKDIHSELSLDLTTFIEAMHVAQYTQLFKNDRTKTRVVTRDIINGRANLNSFHDRIKEETNEGRPVVLALMPGTGQGHAILGYKVEDKEDGTCEISVYDNRWPMRELYLTLLKDSDGNYTAWSYDMDADGNEMYGVWGTKLDGSNISFVYYDTIMEIWNTRGDLAENNNTNLLTINSDDFSLYSVTGEELARVENGVLVKKSNEIDMMDKELSLRNEEETDNVIIAPVAAYRVINKDDSVHQLEITAVNADLGATINTSADEVMVAVQDIINYNAVKVCADLGETYTVSLKSTLADDYKEIIATGTGTEEDASISMVGGVLNVEDCSLSSLIVDGEEQGPFTIKATAATGGTITPEGEQQILKGEDQNYTITPYTGYIINDVLVDGKSIGAVSKYEFKDVSRNHTIEAKFKKTNLYGDANGDGKVNASDLTSLARHLAKIEIIKDTDLFENSDVTHDGKVTSEDLTKLARYVAKIISALE